MCFVYDLKLCNENEKSLEKKKKKKKNAKSSVSIKKKSGTLSLSNGPLLLFFPGIKKTARNNGGCMLIDWRRERKQGERDGEEVVKQ
jgi:hypothetical protein